MAEPSNKLEKWSCASKQTISEIHLGLGVLFTGLSLTGQKFAMEQDIGPLTYNVWRFLVSTTLICVTRTYLQKILDSEYDGEDGLIEGMKSDDEESNTEEIKDRSSSKSLFSKTLLFWGIIVGFCDYCGNTLQQIALVSVPVGKVGFITGMYVVFVPVVEWFMPSRRHLVPPKAWAAALMSMIGTYFLSGCISSSDCMGGAVGRGEILTFISVATWVIQIMAGDVASKHVDVVSLVCVSFFFCTILTIITALIFEYDGWKSPFHMSFNTWGSIITVGASEVAAVTFTTLGQMHTPAARASLLMSLENVSSAVAGFLFLRETLDLLEFFGCVIMFVATLISSVDWGELLYSPGKEKDDIKYTPVRTDDSDAIELIESRGLKSTSSDK